MEGLGFRESSVFSESVFGRPFFRWDLKLLGDEIWI